MPHDIDPPPAAGTATPPPTTTADGFLPLFLAVLSGGLLVLGLQIWREPPPAAARPPYVVVDSDTLLQAQLQQSLTQPGGREGASAPEIAEAMRQELAAAFDRYTQRGLAVLHKAAVIAYPPAVDVTEAVARDLGLPPEFLANARHFQQTGELPAWPPAAAAPPANAPAADRPPVAARP